MIGYLAPVVLKHLLNFLDASESLISHSRCICFFLRSLCAERLEVQSRLLTIKGDTSNKWPYPLILLYMSLQFAFQYEQVFTPFVGLYRVFSHSCLSV